MTQGWMATLGRELGVEPLEATEESELLKLAREVAHRIERRAVPPASFLLGMDVAARVAAGSSRADAISDAFAVLASTLPEGEAEPG